MKKILFTFIFLITFSNLKAQEISWVSFEKAIELNKKTPKLILINVYADWCGYCKKLDKTTFKSKEVIKLINENFYAVKLDGEGKEDITHKGYTFKYKQEGRTKYHEFAATIMDGKLSYPTTIVMNSDEKLLDRIPGYIDEKTMEKVLTFFSSEDYKSKKWEDFVKAFKSNIKS